MTQSHSPISGAQATAHRRNILVYAQPGGRHPGLTLPPTWFMAPADVAIPADCPPPGDRDAVFASVVATARLIRDAAKAAHAEGAHPVLIGGDHSLAMGTIAASRAYHGPIGVIWVDAHGDFNTQDTSPTGNLHGMPLAAACGLGDARLTSLFDGFVDPKHVALVGTRALDDEEKALLDAHGVWQCDMPTFHRLGVAGVLAALEARMAGVPVHLSFDFDAISPEFFPATGTPVPGGLTPEEAEGLLAGLAAGPLQFVSSDWVEFEPRAHAAAECGELARRLQRAFYP